MYHANNIMFRIVASKALAQFFESRTVFLSDVIVDSKCYSRVAKEAMLLHCSEYTANLIHVEKLLLHRDKISDLDVTTLLEIDVKTCDTIRSIMHIHTEIFTPEFVSVWLEVAESNIGLFRRRIKDLVGETSAEAFRLFTAHTTAFLQTVLYSLYELDVILGSCIGGKITTNDYAADNTFFLYLDNSALDNYDTYGVLPLEQRAAVYAKHFGKHNDCVVRNHSSEDIIYPSEACILNGLSGFCNVIAVEQS